MRALAPPRDLDYHQLSGIRWCPGFSSLHPATRENPPVCSDHINRAGACSRRGIFFEMPNKIGLSRDQYFAVQQICRGWNLFGIVLISTIAANLALTIALWKRRRAFWFAVIGLGLVIGSLTIFFLWTYPANEATQNWTTIPGNWQQLRQQWEIAHAASALLTFGALCAVKLVVYALRAP
jgi:hypothetical protein